MCRGNLVKLFPWADRRRFWQQVGLLVVARGAMHRRQLRVEVACGAHTPANLAVPASTSFWRSSWNFWWLSRSWFGHICDNLQFLFNSFQLEPSSVASDWYIDSGATSHLASTPSMLENVTPYHGNSHVYVGNGQSISIHSIGDCELTPSLRLCDVLLVPQITKNLLSISKLTKDLNAYVIFDDQNFLIQHKVTKAAMGRGHNEDGLYVLDRGEDAFVSFISQNNNRASFDLWHARLGHVAPRIMSILVKNRELRSSLILPKPALCEPCVMAKGQRQSFDDNSKRALHVLDLIQYDLWGPAPILSVNEVLLCIVRR